MGDPETQVIMPRASSATSYPSTSWRGPRRTWQKPVRDRPPGSSYRVLASSGYRAVLKGLEVTGREHLEDCMLFHAVTVSDDQGILYTNGGRCWP